MPTLTINGRDVTVDDSFLKLSPDQQNATVDEIAASLGSQSPSMLPAAIADVPGEIMAAGKSALGSIADNLNPFSDARRSAIMKQANNPSFMGGMVDAAKQTAGVGGGVLSVPALAASPVTGAARSLLGHPLADATHAIGTMIDPQLAAKDNPQEMYETAKGGVDLAMAGLAPRGASPKGLRTVKTVPTAAEIKSAATAGYDAAKNSGVELKPSSVQNFTSKVRADLNADGLNDILAPKTFGVLDKMGSPPPGATVTTNDFRTMQRALGHAAGSPDPTERLAATRAIQALNKHIENIPAADLLRGTPADAASVSKTIKEANANYAAYKRAEDFNLRGEKALNNANAANSGMNVENHLRTQVRAILNNPKLQRGYDAETLAAFKAFNKGSRTANILRMVGNALGGGGGWGAVATSVAGNIAIPGVGAATPIVGMAIKSLGNSRAAAEFERLGKMIRAASPLAHSAPMLNAPQVGKLGGSVMGSLLSSNTPRALFPYLLGQVPARADENQRR